MALGDGFRREGLGGRHREAAARSLSVDSLSSSGTDKSERIELKAVPSSHFVYRLIDPESTFLPPGATLPLSDWLVPTKSDKTAGDGRGRPAGLSGFDRDLCPLKTARELLARHHDFAFGATVSELKEIGTASSRQLDVVYLPLAHKAPQAGWDTHVLIEGLRRPDGGEKKAQKDLLEAVVRVLRAA